MTELFESLYPVACSCGVDSAKFWDMTYGEIVAAIKGYQDRKKYEYQMQALISYRQADLLGAFVNKILSGKGKVPTIVDAFPGFFPEDMLRPKQQDWRIMKERIAAHGDRYKQKRGEQQSDVRTTANTDHSRNETIEKGT